MGVSVSVTASGCLSASLSACLFVRLAPRSPCACACHELRAHTPRPFAWPPGDTHRASQAARTRLFTAERTSLCPKSAWHQEALYPRRFLVQGPGREGRPEGSPKRTPRARGDPAKRDTGASHAAGARKMGTGRGGFAGRRGEERGRGEV